MSLQDAMTFWIVVLVVLVVMVVVLVGAFVLLGGVLRRAAARRQARNARYQSAMDGIGADLSRLDILDGLGRELR
ncbi:hypothetical protein [Arthrobacter sp.]|uniref:hypothetical protein n=1 Tax=Arthrobacter sp. TaxID=1667 RepID=UPI003A8DDDD8